MAKQSGGNTAQRVEALVRPTVEGMELRLWDVVFEKEGPDWYLRVLIDKTDGTTMDTDTCADVSHALDPILDEADPIEESYRLQVSSPGIERELTRDWHFERCMGSDVLVRFIRPVEEMNGERDFAGVLSYYENGEAGIILDGTGDDESDGTEMRFELGETAYVRLADDFDYGAAIEDTDDSEED